MLLAWLAGGCGASRAPGPRAGAAGAEASEPASTPAWALQAREPDPGFVHGIGSAGTLDAATQVALQDLASRLSIQVESSLRAVAWERDGREGGRVDSRIETRLLPTQLQGWERTRSARSGDRFWVEVRIDRARLVRSTRRELDEQVRRVDLRLAAADGSALRTLAALELSVAERERTDHLISLLRGLDGNLDVSPWLERRDAWRQADAESRRALRFAVRSDGESQEIARWVVSALAAEQLAVRERGCLEPETVCIDIRSELVEAAVASRYVTQIRSVFAVHEPSGALLGERDLRGRGDSAADRERARRAALEDLRRRLTASPVLTELLVP